jgi:hypothetical protein
LPGEYRQLWSDIQVVLRKGIPEPMINQSDRITIKVGRSSQHTRKGLLKISNRGEVESLTRGNLEICRATIGKLVLKRTFIRFLPKFIIYRETGTSNCREGHDRRASIPTSASNWMPVQEMIQNITEIQTLLKSDLANIVGNEIVD